MTEDRREKVIQALDEVRDAHIDEAAAPKKAKKRWIFRIAAAAAAIALALGVVVHTATISATAVSLPGENRRNYDPQTLRTRVQTLSTFFADGSVQFLDADENSVWSPLNAFLGLAMTAELTQGESRAQILDLLGVQDIDALRTCASDLWEGVHRDNGKEICVAANSLWLNDTLAYKQSAMDDLAYHYYASVYKGEMGSARMNGDIGKWLDKNTGGMLTKYTRQIDLPETTVLALYSTLYVRGTWQYEFSKSNNTSGVFHSPDGDTTATYMNKRQTALYYCWHDNFSAVRFPLKNGRDMWFILPDEGTQIADVLADGTYMQLFGGQWETGEYYLVNLSVPKFDISDSLDLKDGLKELGVTDIFEENKADFSAITDTGVNITNVNQKLRVMIDEEGVKAATYIEIPGAMSAQPPEEIVDFVLDRPFVFVLTSSDVPLLVGTVNQP